LCDAGLPVSIAGAQSGVSGFAPILFAPVIEDPDPGLGPLSGVCSALAATSARYAIFLPVDLPLLPPSLIVCLLDHAQITGAAVTLASVNGFAQTFPAIVDRGTLPALSAELRAGRTGCFAAFQSAAASLALPLTVLPVEFLVQSGRASHPHTLPAALWFLNVNTPADLDRAEAILPKKIA
jgi:molybdopterin-guanine dinucleotide biosynthesis protein A